MDSKEHSPTDIANQLLILLDRRPEGAFPVAETVPVAEPQSHASEDVRKGYTWYWTQDGKIAGLYIRITPSNADGFALEEPDGQSARATVRKIARKYVAAGAKLRREGLRRSSVMNSGNYPEFNLP